MKKVVIPPLDKKEISLNFYNYETMNYAFVFDDIDYMIDLREDRVNKAKYFRNKTLQQRLEELGHELDLGDE